MNEHCHFFWGAESHLSNFYPRYVSMPKLKLGFGSSEQAYMYFKAKFFGDEESMGLIYNSCTTPAEAKKVGRRVKNFDELAWDLVKYEVMVEVLRSKFTTESGDTGMRSFKDKLLNTWPRMLVEASPYDKIWGIGLDEANAKQIPIEFWPGENLLGKALMEVRNEILQGA